MKIYAIIEELEYSDRPRDIKYLDSSYYLIIKDAPNAGHDDH
ncbi:MULTISPECIES: hypothetical protein [Spirulina sp. CCY15215]|nr:hypothetical protein [Spirulina major]